MMDAGHLLGQGGGGDLGLRAVVVGLGVSPVVLRQGADALDVLGAVGAVVEDVVEHAPVDAGVVGEGCQKKTQEKSGPRQCGVCVYVSVGVSLLLLEQMKMSRDPTTLSAAPHTATSPDI